MNNNLTIQVDEITKMAKENFNENICKLIEKLSCYNDASDYGFYHCTKISNLKNIIKYGMIYSRDIAERKNILIYDNKKNNSITNNCLEITRDFFKNKARFYLKKCAPALFELDCTDSCLLVIDYRILFDKSLIKFISFGKAFKNPKIYNPDYEIQNILNMDFKNIFSNEYFEDEFKRSKIKNANSSEFLCDTGVPIKYIKKIIFDNESNLNKFKNLYSDIIKEKQQDFLIVDNTYFGGVKNDYYI